MIHLSVVANDPVLADAIASVLAEEVSLDEVWLTHRELGKGDHHSVVIIVDEGEPENESSKVADLFWNRTTLLMIMISLKSRNLYMYDCYRLVTPELDRVIHIVREFSRMNLKKKVEEDVSMNALRKTAIAPPIPVYTEASARNH
jgi:hypothetical protein